MMSSIQMMIDILTEIKESDEAREWLNGEGKNAPYSEQSPYYDKTIHYQSVKNDLQIIRRLALREYKRR